jgi:opacity protein-like surface antigen
MKNVLCIAMLAVMVSGCALRSKLSSESSNIHVGMNENDFKDSHRRATLVYLANDSTIYEVFKGSGERSTFSDFYYFAQKRLYKFEQKTHYFNNTTVKIEESKANQR